MKKNFREKLREFRLQAIWSVLRFLTAPYFKLKFAYTCSKHAGKGPYLILSNHNTDWDPMLLGLAFKDHISFVASEHIFRWGFTSWLIRTVFDPIARLKGTVAVGTVRDIVNRLKKGVSVAIFAEGNRSFNGRTGEIPASTGKLVRMSGAPLVTFRFSGGYFTSPRWSRNLRKGRMRGEVVHVYQPEELKKMKAEEIQALIEKDLYVDAVEEQRTEKIAYRGQGLAEHLERVLCLCPKCGKIGTLKSEEDRLFCSCGFSVKYNEYGFFEGDELPFDNVTDWDLQQTEKLLQMIPSDDSCIFRDTDMVMKEVFSDHSDQEAGRGEIALYRDHLECCGQSFPIDEISGFILRGPQTINMSAGEKNFEIVSDQVRCTRKYMLLIERLKQDKAAQSA